MLLAIILLPFKIMATLLKLLLKLLLLPIKMIVGGLLLQIGLFLIFLAILAVLAYFAYQYFT